MSRRFRTVFHRPLLTVTAAAALVPGATALAAAAPRHHHVHALAHSPRGTVPNGVLVIQGGGYGHGIGLSQYGAFGLAQQGAGYAAILAHYYSGTALGTVDPNATVRVLLRRGRAAFTGVARVGTTKLDRNRTYSVTAGGDGTLTIRGAHGTQVGPRRRAPLGVGTTGGTVSVAGLGTYRGGLEFRPDGSGGVQTVDVLGLDDYLRGVVPAESPPSWPAAALEAQAVAARTYALTTSVAGNGYSLYRDTRSQMYGGVAAETAATDAAVVATRGQVVTYDGRPVVTYFSSSSGGYTASVQDVWAGATPEPWLRAVPDPSDAAGGSNPYHTWTVTLPLEAAAAKLRGLVKGTLLGVRIVRHGDSPRVLAAEILGSGGSTPVTGEELQQRFGLETTLVTFTTITIGSTSQSPRSGGVAAAADRWTPSRIVGEALAALGPMILGHMSASPARVLRGTVLPAPTGDRVAIEERLGMGWRRVGTLHLGHGGRYRAVVATAGTYRVRWRRATGPAVTVS